MLRFFVNYLFYKACKEMIKLLLKLSYFENYAIFVSLIKNNSFLLHEKIIITGPTTTSTTTKPVTTTTGPTTTSITTKPAPVQRAEIHSHG